MWLAAKHLLSHLTFTFNELRFPGILFPLSTTHTKSSTIMPQAPVGKDGTELFYTDSGPIPGSNNYTTLVIFHGSAFTGREFHRRFESCSLTKLSFKPRYVP